MVHTNVAPTPWSSPEHRFIACPVDEILATNTDIVARIKLCYGAARDGYERDVLSVIRRYATYVHQLPATRDSYFSAPGGLLRLGLEAAFFSLQGTDAHIVSGRSTISTRRLLEPRWRHATFIAGLCCEIHRVLSHMVVTDTQGAVWSGYLQPLTTWLQARNAKHYLLSWRASAFETPTLAVFALAHVVPAEVLTYLSEDNATVIPQLMASISGVALYRDHNVLDDLVRRSRALVIDRNLAADADGDDSPSNGAHLERYLVDALRRLISSDSNWIPNVQKSRVWFGRDGLFLLWPGAADDLRKLLDAEKLAGMPKTAQIMLEILLAAGVLEACDASQTTWTIQPPGFKTLIETVKFSHPALLFAGLDAPPVPLNHVLARRQGEPDPNTPISAPVTKSPIAPKDGAQMTLIPPHVAPEPTATATGTSVATEPSATTSHTQATDANNSSTFKSTATLAPSPVSFNLNAPFRLNPAVRDAVAAVVQSLNDDAGPALGCITTHGFFVPLSAFDLRGVQASTALRALADVGMLVSPQSNGQPTVSRNFNGAPTTGLVIDPRFVEGLDLQAFVLPSAKGP